MGRPATNPSPVVFTQEAPERAKALFDEMFKK
jgi:hypothetical protein